MGDRPQGVAGDCNSLAETHAWFDSRVAHHYTQHAVYYGRKVLSCISNGPYPIQAGATSTSMTKRPSPSSETKEPFGVVGDPAANLFTRFECHQSQRRPGFRITNRPKISVFFSKFFDIPQEKSTINRRRSRRITRQCVEICLKNLPFARVGASGGGGAVTLQPQTPKDCVNVTCCNQVEMSHLVMLEHGWAGCRPHISQPGPHWPAILRRMRR